MAVSDIYPMFIEPTITWVPPGLSGYIWLDTKIVLKNSCDFFRYLRNTTYVSPQKSVTPKMTQKTPLSNFLNIILSIIEDCEAIDQGRFTVGIFIDLAKAFDTVNHAILLAKLSFYGIRGLSYQWFASYLNNRKQYVSLDGVESQCAYVKCGVPQGSILGPILFLIYINDLNTVSQKLKNIMFADDTNLFVSGRSVIEITQEINKELSVVAEWFQANLLSLNVKKNIIFNFW